MYCIQHTEGHASRQSYWSWSIQVWKPKLLRGLLDLELLFLLFFAALERLYKACDREKNDMILLKYKTPMDNHTIILPNYCMKTQIHNRPSPCESPVSLSLVVGLFWFSFCATVLHFSPSSFIDCSNIWRILRRKSFLQLLPAVGKCNSFSFPFNILNKHSLSSPWASFVCASVFGWQSCVHCSMSRSLSLSLLPLDVSVSLLSLLVTTCGLALFSVSLFVSWKLCWVPLSGRFFPDVLKGAHFLGGDQQPVLTEVSRKRCLPSKVDDLVQWVSCSLLNDSDFLDVNIA